MYRLPFLQRHPGHVTGLVLIQCTSQLALSILRSALSITSRMRFLQTFSTCSWALTGRNQGVKTGGLTYMGSTLASMCRAPSNHERGGLNRGSSGSAPSVKMLSFGDHDINCRVWGEPVKSWPPLLETALSGAGAGLRGFRAWSSTPTPGHVHVFLDKYLDTIIVNSIFLAFFGMAARSYQAVMSYHKF